MQLYEQSISEAVRLLAEGKVSPIDLTNACLERIEQENPRLNAFITVTTMLATQQAHQAEVTLKRRKSVGLLRGIPLALKDLIHVAGVPTTAGSRFPFPDHGQTGVTVTSALPPKEMGSPVLEPLPWEGARPVPDEDACVFEKLRTAGAILLGKLNLHEIALGVTNENPHFGDCKNPWNPDHIAGGSSGGCAVALATGMTYGAIGTDTGGSIRIPSALCGVVGLKPTYGRVSVRGVLPLSWYLDHVGPMARTVGDAAVLFKVIAGFDAADPYSVVHPVKDVLAHLADGVRGWRVALASDPYFDDADPEVLAAVSEAGAAFERLGAIVERVPFPGARDAAYANGLMTQADAAAIHRQRLAEHPEWFGADVRQRLQKGASTGLGEYQQARRVQSTLCHQFEHFFERFEILLTPTTPIPAPRRGGDAVERARLLTRFTAPFNLTGLPALSVPCGRTRSNLPIGLQIIARPWAEATVLQAGYAYQQVYRTYHEIINHTT
jgi:aspartyl-tRNA(Asn)/glutamyl-tRNA(Gln) amidotransferase subunit A